MNFSQNRNVKKLFSSLVYYSGISHLWKMMRRMTSGRPVTILMYHRIENIENNFAGGLISTTPQLFRQQMNFLKKNCTVITFDDLLAIKNGKPCPKNAVLITFDDGYLDNYTHAFPVLRELDLPATIALSVNSIDKKELLWWDNVAYLINHSKKQSIRFLRKAYQLDTSCGRIQAMNWFGTYLKGKSMYTIQKTLDHLSKATEVQIPSSHHLYLNWNHVKEMGKYSITYSPHTMSHVQMSSIPVANALKEVEESREVILEKGGSVCPVFTYPFGGSDDMSSELDKELMQKGYTFALSTIEGLNKITNRSFVLKRIGISTEDDLNMFALKIHGLPHALTSITSSFSKVLNKH